MKIAIRAVALALLLVASPALAQWQTPNHSVPIGRGGGVTGFGNAAPGTSGQPLVSGGSTVDPAFGPIGNSGFTVGPANTAKGTLDGVSTTDLPLPGCTGVNQAWRYTSGTGINCGNITVQTGYDMPINLGLSASAAGSALTIGLTQANGSAPTGSNPVLVPFRSTSLTTGTVVWDTITASTSLTIPSGATLGTSSSNVSFRIWIFLEHNGGAPALAVATCSNATNIFPCSAWESTLKTSTTISGSAGTAGVLYAANGVSADAVRIVGFCDFSGGLTTAGTWASSCTTLQMMGPGVKKPGDIVQTGSFGTSSTTSCTSAGITVATAVTKSISPTSAANLVSVRGQTTSGGPNATNGGAATQLARGAGTLIGQSSSPSFSIGGGAIIGFSQFSEALDQPNTVSSTAYTIYCGGAAGTWTHGGGSIRVEEIMG